MSALNPGSPPHPYHHHQTLNFRQPKIIILTRLKSKVFSFEKFYKIFVQKTLGLKKHCGSGKKFGLKKVGLKKKFGLRKNLVGKKDGSVKILD